MKKFLLNIGLALAIIIQVHPACAMYQMGYQAQSEKLWTVLKQPKTLIGLSAAAGVTLVSIAVYQLVRSFNKKSEQTITSLNQLLNYKNFTSPEGQKALEVFFETATRGISKGLQTRVNTDAPSAPTTPAYVEVLNHLEKTPAHQDLITNTIQKLLTGILPHVLPQAPATVAPTQSTVPAWQPILDYIMQDEKRTAFVERLLQSTAKTGIQAALAKPTLASTTAAQTADSDTPQPEPKPEPQPLQDFVTYVAKNPDVAALCTKLVGTASHGLGYGYAEADAKAVAQVPGTAAPEGAVSKFLTFLKQNPGLAASLMRSLAAGYAKGDAVAVAKPATTVPASAPATKSTSNHWAVTQYALNFLSKFKKQ